MLNINRTTANLIFNATFNYSKSPVHLQNYNIFLDSMLLDNYVNSNLNIMAYFLATSYWETDNSMAPIVEVRQVAIDTPRRREVRALQDRYWSTGYYGRGYVQLTWESNYKSMSEHLLSEYPNLYQDYKPDFLVSNPDLAINPAIAYDIMSCGMRGGYFSGGGRGIAYYINSNSTDYINARRTVNGTDNANTIADLAKQFETLLKTAQS